LKGCGFSFSIERWLIWKVGNGHRVRVGEDPSIGSGLNYKLPENHIFSLHEKGIFFLHRVTDPDMTSIWRKEWKSAETIGLEDSLVQVLKQYLSCPRTSHVS
jgi:hypothetical protein